MSTHEPISTASAVRLSRLLRTCGPAHTDLTQQAREGRSRACHRAVVRRISHTYSPEEDLLRNQKTVSSLGP